jgi:crotonobetainyl-CoA:carnitine CoA-transferase CaiB-like acyl-CoA transferase
VWLDHPQIQSIGMRVEVDDPERGRVVMPGVPLVLSETPGSVRAPAPRLAQHDDGAGHWSPRSVPAGSPPPPSLSGPLAGVRVLDLGTILAGPFAGTLLAELGADVIKVEAPAGDAFREPGYVYNRGQRGLAIDLSSPAGQRAFHELVRSADVVLDNARLGVLERLHVDYATLAQINPRIVSLSITGFGVHGLLAAKPGFDPVLQAMSGMMTAQGGDSEPVLFSIPVNDVAAATWAVFGTGLALFHRARSGLGQRAWTSLAGCSAIMQAGELVRFAGRPPAVMGGRDFAGPAPYDRFYSVADGWVRVQAADSSEPTRELLRSLGTLTREEAVSRLTAAGIPAAPARHPAELPSDPELSETQVFSEHCLQDGTPYFSTHRYAHFSRTEQSATLTSPGLGEHSRQVLVEAGLKPAQIDTLIEAGVVVEGRPFQLPTLTYYR